LGVSGSPWASSSPCASTFSTGSAIGSTGAFLLLALGFFIGTTIEGATRAPPLRLSSSVDNVEGLISPRVARAAISPSFVVGAYAPPANLNPHFLQCHTPTLHRLTVLNMHRGHSCLERSPVTIAMYRRRVTVPYRAPKPPARPVFRVISLSPRP
jgi:hypothetical protein